MLVLAHTGITLGAGLLADGARGMTRRQGGSLSRHHEHRKKAIPIDYRLILIGALLPDLIDKPLGLLGFGGGRALAHTLVFTLFIAFAGLYLYWRQGKPWLLFLAFGSLVHLILDQMWLTPRVLFYPLYGWAFPVTDFSHWFEDMLHELLTDPTVYIPEIIGATILIAFAVAVIRRRTIKVFLRGEDF
jgi:inner membrane protein